MTVAFSTDHQNAERAERLLRDGRWAAARRALRAALREDAANPVLAARLVWLDAYSGTITPDAAEAIVRDLAAANPDAYQVAATAAAISALAGRWQQAVAALEGIVAEHPDDARMQLSLAAVLLNAEQFDEAWEHFQIAFKEGGTPTVGRIHQLIFYSAAKRHGRGWEARDLILPRLSLGERLGLLTAVNSRGALAIVVAEMILYRIGGDFFSLLAFAGTLFWLVAVNFVYSGRGNLIRQMARRVPTIRATYPGRDQVNR